MTILRPSFLRRVANSIRLSRRKRAATVDVTPTGFVYSQGRKSVDVSWDDISQIDAGVRDYVTFDSFYIVVFAREKKLVIEEVDDGFRQLELRYSRALACRHANAGCSFSRCRCIRRITKRSGNG